jgi:hypothetical protein
MLKAAIRTPSEVDDGWKVVIDFIAYTGGPEDVDAPMLIASHGGVFDTLDEAREQGEKAHEALGVLGIEVA